MKSIYQSMTPLEAAQSFYGKDEVAFSEMIKKLTASDPRLATVFKNVRKRHLDQKS